MGEIFELYSLRKIRAYSLPSYLIDFVILDPGKETHRIGLVVTFNCTRSIVRLFVKQEGEKLERTKNRVNLVGFD